MDKVWTGNLDFNIIAHGQLLFYKNMITTLSQQNKGLARIVNHFTRRDSMDFIWTISFLPFCTSRFLHTYYDYLVTNQPLID